MDYNKLVDKLMINASLEKDPGLVNGKMGIAIFFSIYGHCVGNGLYLEYAFDLIELIQQQIHFKTPVNYFNGLSGIGRGVCYLIDCKYLDADKDILDDFDSRIYEAVIRGRYDDFSLYNGLTGYGRYWLYREVVSEREAVINKIVDNIQDNICLISESERFDVIEFATDLLKTSDFSTTGQTLIGICRSHWGGMDNGVHIFPRLGFNQAGQSVRKYLNCEVITTFQDKPDSEFDLTCTSSNVHSNRMGILDGLAGEMLNALTCSSLIDSSWMKLI